VDKFYFSHLNYAGRGNIHRGKDAQFQATRDALDLLFERAWQSALEGREEDYVTGNNDADGPYLLQWVRERMPQWEAPLRERLIAWGGNSSGVNVANIDNLGTVHPDTMWWHHDLGNVRQRPFSAIWSDTSEPLMAGLKAKPRPVGGRCAVLPLLQHLRRQHPRARPAAHGRRLGRRPGLLPARRRDRAGAGSDAQRVAVTPFSNRRRTIDIHPEAEDA
jgi:MoaA/NifB/PqqE/SkfB family radical SAM enzyme